MSRDQPAQTPWGRTWRAFPPPGPGGGSRDVPAHRRWPGTMHRGLASRP